MLIEARGKDAEYVIHLTYDVVSIDAQRRKSWDKDRASEIKRRDKKIAERKPASAVREEWDEDKHGLGTLFAARPMVMSEAASVWLNGTIGRRIAARATAQQYPEARLELPDQLTFGGDVALPDAARQLSAWNEIHTLRDLENSLPEDPGQV